MTCSAVMACIPLWLTFAPLLSKYFTMLKFCNRTASIKHESTLSVFPFTDAPFSTRSLTISNMVDFSSKFETVLFSTKCQYFRLLLSSDCRGESNVPIFEKGKELLLIQEFVFTDSNYS